MEREEGKWQNRLKRGLRFTVMLTAGVALMILNLAFPKMYPKDLEGLGILVGASVVLAAFFSAAYCAQEWVDARSEGYWFWRTASVLLFLAMAGGMLYAMFATAAFWLPHFQNLTNNQGRTANVFRINGPGSHS